MYWLKQVSRGVALLSYPGEEASESIPHDHARCNDCIPASYVFVSLQKDLNAPSPSVLVQRVFAQQRDGGHDAQVWVARVEHSSAILHASVRQPDLCVAWLHWIMFAHLI